MIYIIKIAQFDFLSVSRATIAQNVILCHEPKSAIVVRYTIKPEAQDIASAEVTLRNSNCILIEEFYFDVCLRLS